MSRERLLTTVDESEELNKREGVLDITLGELMDIQARNHPDNDALVYVDRGLRYTYREFNEVCRNAAKGFMKSGFRKYCGYSQDMLY